MVSKLQKCQNGPKHYTKQAQHRAADDRSGRKSLLLQICPPPKYGQKHAISLDTMYSPKDRILKHVYLGQNMCPVARSRTEITPKTPKNIHEK